MAYTKTTWVNDQQPDIDADNLNKMEQGIYDAQFPDGGTEGQLLARTANGQGWVDAPNSAVWGLIQGTLSDQTDLATALENTGKVDTVNGIQPDVSKNVQVDVEITKQGWDALPSTKYTDDINYYIKDGTNIPQAGVISASGVTYSNTSSGLDATTVQGAIDENASEIADVKSGLNGVRLVPFTKKVTLPAGTAGNPTTTQASLAEFIPSGWVIKTIIAQLGAYYLPYIVVGGGTNVALTWIEFVYNNTGIITIKNSATGWTDYELRGVLLLVRA